MVDDSGRGLAMEVPRDVDEMDEDSWEEELVMVDLSGLIDPDWFSKIGSKCKIVGIDSDQPVLQLGRHIFSGQYTDSIGTRVIFEKETTSDLAGGASGPVSLKYYNHTFKVLNMQKIFLNDKTEKPKTAAEDGEAATSSRSSEAADLAQHPTS